MTVQVLAVKMCGDHGFVPFTQQTAGKLHAGRVCLLRCDLAGGVGMDDVVAENAAAFVPPALGRLHLCISGLHRAVDAGPQAVCMGRRGFPLIADVMECGGKVGFVLVRGIGKAMIQPSPDGDDLVVSHSQRLLDEPPRPTDQRRGLLNIRFAGALLCVRPICDLVDIVADGGQLA